MKISLKNSQIGVVANLFVELQSRIARVIKTMVTPSKGLKDSKGVGHKTQFINETYYLKLNNVQYEHNKLDGVIKIFFRVGWDRTCFA